MTCFRPQIGQLSTNSNVLNFEDPNGYAESHGIWNKCQSPAYLFPSDLSIYGPGKMWLKLLDWERYHILRSNNFIATRVYHIVSYSTEFRHYQGTSCDLLELIRIYGNSCG